MSRNKDYPPLTSYFDEFMMSGRARTGALPGYEWPLFKEDFAFYLPSGYVPRGENLVRHWQDRTALRLLKAHKSQYRFSEGTMFIKPLLEAALIEQQADQTRRLTHAGHVVEKVVIDQYYIDKNRGTLPKGSIEEILDEYRRRYHDRLKRIAG